MFEDYSERLFAHFVAGRWRAPFAASPLVLTDATGCPLGQIVPASAADLARAQAALRGADDADCQRAAQCLLQGADWLARAIALQTGARPGHEEIAQMARQIATPRTGSAGVISRALPFVDSNATLGEALGAGLRGGVIWCPVPDQAIFATTLAQLFQQADLPAGAFNLVHASVPQTRAALRPLGLRELG